MNPENTTDPNAWKTVLIHFGKKKGTVLGDLSERDLKWWKESWFPNGQFCKSKLSEKIEEPAREEPAWTEPPVYDDGEHYPEVHHPASTIPARTRTIIRPDPAACPDCRLREALNQATFVTTTTVASEVTGVHAGTVGQKLTVTDATVESVKEYENKFNNKKVIENVAFLRAGPSLYKWASSSMPAALVEGAIVTLTGTVKDHRESQGERITVLTRCKIAGAAKLAPTHGLTLFCDAKASADRWAYCDHAGHPLEYGKFQGPYSEVDFWPIYNGEQSNAEVCAALLAFDFARRVREARQLDSLLLHFNFDAKWMKGLVGKAKPLRDFARKHGLVVDMRWIAGTENPADEWTVADGERFIAATAVDELATMAIPIASRIVEAADAFKSKSQRNLERLNAL